MTVEQTAMVQCIVQVGSLPGAAANCASSQAAISSSVCLGFLLASAKTALTGSAVAAATGRTKGTEASAVLTTSPSARQGNNYALVPD